jgi:hypothetical protein
MKPTRVRIADLWCRLMHTAPMWPSHGHYECRTCGRRHPVCWEQLRAAMPPVMALAEPKHLITHRLKLGGILEAYDAGERTPATGALKVIIGG